MRNDVKKSLDTVFEHAKLNEKHAKQKKPKRNWLPTVALAGIVAIAALLLLLPIASDKPQLDSATNSESDIFEMKGTYIGDASKVSTIVAHALPEGMYNGIELETKQEPYGVIVPLDKVIEESSQLQVAMYVFTLIQNADFIKVEMPKATSMLEKEKLTALYELDFSTIASEFELKKKLNKINGVKWVRPQLQLIGQSISGNENLIEQLIATAQIVEEEVNLERIQYVVGYDENEYLFFVDNEEIRFVVNTSPAAVADFNPTIVYKVTDEMAERFVHYVNGDFVAISGEVTMIGSNMIQVEQSEQLGNLGEEKLLHALVDDVKDFKVGDLVQVWTNEVTKQYPPQAMATKIKYFGSITEMGIREILQKNDVPLVEVEAHTNTVFGVALNKVKPTVYELDGKFVYLFEFENEAQRIKGVEEFNDNTKFMDLTSFETYEKGAYLLFYVHDYDLSSKNIPYVEEIQAVFDML